VSTRYAIYYAPAPDSRWWQFGSRWLGRDAASGRSRAQFQVPGISAEELRELTADVRRYGFHATLKPPFVLSEQSRREELYACVEALAAGQRPIPLGRLGLRKLGGFLALMPEQQSTQLQALAIDCVEQLDAFRAQAGEDELRRRRHAGLSPRQDELLLRWGYPYVMEQWRFHMTLTGPVAGARREALMRWLEVKLHELDEEQLQVDALCIFEQSAPGAAFCLSRRYALRGAGTGCSGGTRGRLLYVVGPSGAGKDSLIAYARARLSSRPMAFARRYITRPARDARDDGEQHHPVSQAEFDALLRHGKLALHWRSHGLAYGVGTEIDQWMEQGLDVVVNGSREYLAQARLRYPDLALIWIDAPEQTLRDRLQGRAREDAADAQERLLRAARYAPPADAIVIVNDGLLHEAGARLSEVLLASANRPESAGDSTG